VHTEGSATAAITDREDSIFMSHTKGRIDRLSFATGTYRANYKSATEPKMRILTDIKESQENCSNVV